MAKKVLCGLTAFFCLSLFSAGTGQDQDDKNSQEKLEHTVTVTADRLRTPERETASSLTVITREELKTAGIHTVVEALRESAGLNVVQNGPPGSAASVFIRGADSAQTKIMLDGVEMNDPITPSRSFDFSHLLVENIERIEIIRGPQSPLYGSDAMAGVINIISRESPGEPKFRLAFQGGSYGTASGHAEAAGGGETIQYSFGTSYYRTEGFSAAGAQYPGNQEKDGYCNFSLFGKLSFQLRDNLEWRVSARGIKARTDLDNMGGAYGDDPNHDSKYDSYILHTGLRALFADNRWESRVDLSYVDSSRRYHNPEDEANLFSEESEYFSDMVKFNWQNNIFIHSASTLTLGLEYLREKGRSSYSSSSAWGDYQDTFPETAADHVGVFIQDRISADGRFFFSIGGRWDHHSRAGSALTWRLAPSFLIPETGTRLKATAGTGFKAPSLYQLFAPAAFWGPVGNLSLKPERSFGWDAGFEQEFSGRTVVFGITYFSNRYRNLIDFDHTQGYINVGEASSRGWEFSLQSRPAGPLSFHSTYTRLQAENDITGQPLIRRPRHKFTLEGRGRWGDSFQARLSLLYVGKRPDLFYSGITAARVTLDDYILINSSASYEMPHGFTISLRLENILNQEYELVKGYGTPGFSIYAGLEYEF